MEIESFIGNVPLFKGLPAPQIKQLASIAVYKPYKKGSASSPKEKMLPVFMLSLWDG